MADERRKWDGSYLTGDRAASCHVAGADAGRSGIEPMGRRDEEWCMMSSRMGGNDKVLSRVDLRCTEQGRQALGKAFAFKLV